VSQNSKHWSNEKGPSSTTKIVQRNNSERSNATSQCKWIQILIFVIVIPMIIIVYGSILRSSSNNRAALIGCHGRQLHLIIANWLCQLPTLPPPFFTCHAKVDILLDSLFLNFLMTSSSGLRGHTRPDI
jgi:hypothetical protein